MPRIRSSSRGRAPTARVAASVRSFRRSCMPPRPPGLTASSSRRTPTHPAHPPTAPTWCRSISSPGSWASPSTSGSAPEGGRPSVREVASAAQQLVDRGKRVLALEAAAVQRLADTLGPAFGRAVHILAPATVLHPVDSLPGDLGIVSRDDVAIVLSKSGASDELFGLVNQLKRLGVPLIALTGEADSPLGRQATVVLDASVVDEACPETLAPTASTTVALALGDALAVTLLEVKGFRREDFAALHPGGALGRKLLLRVADVMLTQDLPTLTPDRPMRECVVLLAEKRGTVVVVDRNGKGTLAGVVTAGDLTRLMERTDNFLDIPVGDVMTKTPKVATPEDLAGAAVSVMERHGIMALPVLDGGKQVVGIVHLHDLMKAGAV